jgi:protein pelota
MNLKKGIAKVLPDSLDDLWHLYNVILEKDKVHARTTRELKVEGQYARPRRGKRVPVLLGVRVEKLFWDRILNRLRIHGIVCDAPEKIDIKGSHHTIDVTLNKPVTIVKTEWLRHQIERLKRASRVTAAPLIIISMDDEEYCVAVLRQYGVDVKAEEKTRLPGKLEAEKRADAMRGFFKTASKVLREVWTSFRSPIVIIGPGFIKNDFFKYVKREVTDIANAVIDVKGVNNAGVAGIHEALRSGVFTKALKYVRVAEETKVMEEVLARLGKGRGDTTYGLVEVEKASAYGSVEKLLVADTTLREAPDEKRKALEKIMKEVEEKGGQIMVISTEHEAGTELLSLGGVAALLRFPLG